ncbi:Nucleic-acid-binding protein from transposon X-element [Araneus ventricosus]|uniref:Nucleic-acid-binding protein from transposon X-element n=1 Tax=Araneus ventricosus TaxID=182803 RepID=A0A4Y2BAC9_ARAVE|nr:Nucleic-acid-binding protein from transposon X-element [Araneus ventricosus]
MSYLRIKVQPLRKLNFPGQCYNCQQLFHHSKFCSRDMVCVKCAGKHKSKDCVKPPTTPAKCALCGSSHTASYPGCPKKLQHKQTQSATNKTIITDNPVTPGKSCRDITANNIVMPQTSSNNINTAPNTSKQHRCDEIIRKYEYFQATNDTGSASPDNSIK